MNKRIRVKKAIDYSNRYMIEIENIDINEYHILLSKLIIEFQLEPKGNKIIGYDEQFQYYIFDKYIISMEYDIWTGFTIVSQNEYSKTLVDKIYTWLIEENKFKE